jgi:exonuclease III
LLGEILQKSAGFANTSFLFCGDWNVVQNKSDDIYNVIHDRNQNARKKIEEQPFLNITLTPALLLSP